MESQQKTDILERYLRGTATPHEVELVDKWLENMSVETDETGEMIPSERDLQVQALYQRIGQTIEGGGKVVKMRGRRWLSAAAVILALLASGIWFSTQQRDIKADEEVALAESQPIGPGSNKAVLTLADGEKVVLDSLAEGTLTTQGGITLIQQGAVLAYEGKEGGRAQLNTVTTPKGGQFMVVLNDGSKVWLNAASSITFPVAFDKEMRKVSITGEVYFEVEHGQTPFVVQKDGMEITVLGTRFNVDSYDENMAITLLQGKVQVTNRDSGVTLQPGEQAVVHEQARKIDVRRNVDVQASIAWKNGYFSFNNAGLRDILHELSRWYDVEIEYRGGVPDARFSGEIGMKLNLDEVLDILTETRVPYKIEGRKIVINP